MNVYDQSAIMLQGLLAHRRSDFRAKCLLVALWILRTHGPHGCRIFPLPRHCRRLQERLGLTQAEIRNVCSALEEIGLLKRESEARELRTYRDPPTQYSIGVTFQTLFPVAKELARSASTTEGVRRTQFTSNHSTSETDIIRAPLVEASCNTITTDRLPAFVRTKDHPLGRPVLFRHPKTQKSLLAARLEALRGLELPKLSQEALRTLKGAPGASYRLG